VTVNGMKRMIYVVVEVVTV